MDWQHIAHMDPFLAGSIAARSWEWWQEATAETEADSVGLTAEQREKFLAGWQHEVAEQELERKTQKWNEYEAMAQGYEKGDPAARTSWR